MRRPILFAAALMLVAAPAAAQQSQPSQPGQPSPQSPQSPQSPPMPFFRGMDTNNDGAVSQDEFLAAHQRGGKGYGAADQNNDGVVSRDEFLQAGQQRREARFQQLDRNKDGQLTQEELQQHSMAMFRSMDANSDGRITQEEIRHKRGRGMGPGMMQQQGQMPPEDMPMGPGWDQR